MASSGDSNPALVWDYATNVPPYTLFDRALSPYLSPKDFHDVGLGSPPDGALRSTPEDRMQMAREMRRTALDALFREVHAQDARTWEKCMRAVGRRTEAESDEAWVGATVELILREKEMKDPINPAEPMYADRATFHLAEGFFARLNGTVWLETASDCGVGHTQENMDRDMVLKYRDGLVLPVKLQLENMQRVLFKSCRSAENNERPSHEEYMAAAERVKQAWRVIEAEEVALMCLL